jgi:hypothetical protein
MKESIFTIASRMQKGEITPEQAKEELLVLFRVGWQSEQLMPKCTACNIMPKHPVLGAHCKDSNCPHEH